MMKKTNKLAKGIKPLKAGKPLKAIKRMPKKY